MYPGPPPEADRRVTWRSVTVGFLLNAAMFLFLVAVSHPVATAAVVATGIGAYALGGIVRRAGIERTFQFCRGGFCLRLQFSVG